MPVLILLHAVGVLPKPNLLNKSLFLLYNPHLLLRLPFLVPVELAVARTVQGFSLHELVMLLKLPKPRNVLL
jgi:hypothetical protein